MKFSTLMPLVGLIAGSFVLAGCDTQAQERTSQVRDLAGFRAIEAGGGIELEVRQADDFHVEVSGTDLDDLITEVADGTLRIRHRPGPSRLFRWWGPDASVSVSLPVIESLAASGGSDTTFRGRISGESLSVVASGGSDVEIDVAVTSLRLMTSGGSDVRLSGTADTAMLHASGGSDLNGRDFLAREVQIETSGGSDAVFGVEERLSGSASGGSDIAYSGNPETVEVSTSGGSDLVRR